MAEKFGEPAPANATILQVVRELESSAIHGNPPRFLPPNELRKRIEHAASTGEIWGLREREAEQA
jgi:hypothetical protein